VTDVLRIFQTAFKEAFDRRKILKKKVHSVGETREKGEWVLFKGMSGVRLSLSLKVADDRSSTSRKKWDVMIVHKKE